MDDLGEAALTTPRPLSTPKTVIEAKTYLIQRRDEIARLSTSGLTGLDVSHLLAEMIDEAIAGLYLSALNERTPDDRESVERLLAIAPLGGYGRRDLAPYSDVDLLFLHERHEGAVVAAFIKRLVRDIWDAGLSLGQQVGSPDAILALARDEVLPATALMETRPLLGCDRLVQALSLRFHRYLSRGGAVRLRAKAIAAVSEEQQSHGSTPYLLEPDIKKSAGGLRDWHLLRWIALAFFNTADLAALEQAGQLGIGDAATITAGHEFLLRVRHDLHFAAGRSADVLLRSEQMRIAASWGYKGTASLLPVEQFMRDYFQATAAIAEATARFVENTRPRKSWESVRDVFLSHKVADGVTQAGGCLYLTDAARARYLSSLEHTLELLDLAQASDSDLDWTTIEGLRQTYRRSPSVESSSADAPALSPVAVKRFLEILSRPGRLASLLRLLHQVGVLERLIPEFEHARGLLQFNAYHKFTVDEHTFVMIHEAERMLDSNDLVGKMYRRVARKDLLHLAILLHDLGKGFEEDHSEVGRRIARALARRYRLAAEDALTLETLVHQHLLLSTLAYHRDTSDPAVHVLLSKRIGTAERLRELYALTVADNIAVGPGAFTQWKADLLRDLFISTMALLGEEVETGASDQGGGAIRERLLKDHGHDERTRGFIERLPASYLVETSLEHLVAALLHWQGLEKTPVATLTEYQPKAKTTFYTVLTHEGVCEGIFHKICGALSSHRLDILSARIHTLQDGTVIDRFEVVDTHHVGEPSAERCKMIGATIRKVLLGELNVDDILWTSRSTLFPLKPRLIPRDSIRIEIDNDSSETLTTIDIFSPNRRGLLYTVTREMFRLGLSVQYARILTYGDEVVDAFYVCDGEGKKVLGQDRIRLVQDHLTRDIERLATDPRSMGF